MIALNFHNFKNNKVSEGNTVVKEKVFKDTVEQKAPKYKKAEINYDKSDTLIKVSKPFIINGIKCFWEFELTLYEGSKGGSGKNKLKNNNTNKVLLLNPDYAIGFVVRAKTAIKAEFL
jgi:hypothetical protein